METIELKNYIYPKIVELYNRVNTKGVFAEYMDEKISNIDFMFKDEGYFCDQEIIDTDGSLRHKLLIEEIESISVMTHPYEESDTVELFVIDFINNKIDDDVLTKEQFDIKMSEISYYEKKKVKK